MEETAERQSHFGIRKLTIGATSVLLGTTLWLGTNTSSVNAAVNGNDSQETASTDSNKNGQPTTSDIKIEVPTSPTTLDVPASDKVENTQSQEAAASTTDTAQTTKAENKASSVAKNEVNEDPATQINDNDSLQTQSVQGNNHTVDTNQASQSNEQEVTEDQSNIVTSNVQLQSSQPTEKESQNSAQQNTDVESHTTVAQFQGLKTRSASLSAAQLSSLLNTSLVATSGEDAVDIDTYKPNFNLKNTSQVYDGHVVYSGYTDKATGTHWQFATDPDNPGQTIYLYKNGTLADQLSENSGSSKSVYIGSNQTVNGSSYTGGQYTFNVSSSNKGGIAFSRLDIVGQNGSVVNSGMTADITQSGKTLVMDLDKNEANPSTWQSGGASVPTKAKQTIWYVDATTGKVLAQKDSDATLSGSIYDDTDAQVPLIQVGGKYYKLVERSNNTVQKTVRVDVSATNGTQTTTEPVTEYTYKSSDLKQDGVLTTNNGVQIKASDLLNVPLTGTLSSLRIGDVGITNTGYAIATGALIPNRFYVTQQKDAQGTVDLNSYNDNNGSASLITAGNISTNNLGTYVPMYFHNKAYPNGQLVFVNDVNMQPGPGVAAGDGSMFINQGKGNNQDVIILYTPTEAPVTTKQNANITFVNDDTGASLSPQQDASGDAGSQISFDNAASTVAKLIDQGYVYNGTTGTGVTNGSASGSFTGVGFPVYDNDDKADQAFVVHFKSPVQTTTYHQGVEESKTIKRTINYYDKITGEKIPSNLISQNPYSDSVTFTRTQVLDQDGKVVGYGTISSDGKSFKTQDWHTATGESKTQFDTKKSPDLSASNYTAPEFQDGNSAGVVAAHDVTPTTQDLVYNVYYGHQTQQVTTNKDVTRRFHYIFTDGTTPESHLTPQADQKVSFTGTATKDLVTGRTGDTVWTPSTGTLAQVSGQQVASYHITGNVNANTDGSADAVTVNPDSSDIDVTIVYTPDAKTPDTPQKAKVIIYDKTENNKQLTAFENNNGAKGSTITFDGEPQTLQAYLSSGYVFDSATDANGNSIGSSTSNIAFGNFDDVDGNVQNFNIYLVHGTDTKTEKATTNAHVHYVVAGNEANKPAAPADSPTQTINWIRTTTTDKVTNTTTEGQWTPDKTGFTSVTSPTLTGYTPDQAVANFTTPQPNRDQVVTVVYNPNPQEDQKADLVIYDKTDNNKELNSFNNSGKASTQISFSGSANYVADLIAKGYKIDSFVNDQNQTSNPTSYDQINFSNFDNDGKSDQHFKLYLVHDTENVTDKKTTTSTVHYVVSDGKTNPPSDNVQTITWTRPGTKDKVTGVTIPTGDWTSPDHYDDVPTPNLDGYTPDKTNVPAPTPDPNQNPTTKVTYNPKTTEAPTYTGTTETKDVTRTINYYDKVTGEKIPNELIKENPTTQTVTLSRTHVISSTGQDMGYGSVSADGKNFTKAATADGWNTGEWAQVISPNLSNAGYTAPDLAQADHVTVDANTKDAVVNVYYGHQTEVITPKTPHNPGGEINPNDPRNKPSVYPDGLTKAALTTEVTRKINYVGVNEDETTTPVNGSPDGKNTYTQTASFERNAVVDKVTGQIIGYSTDGTTNVSTTDKDRAWTPATQNMSSVDSKTPSEVGYDKVDISTVGGVTVYPGQKIKDVTVTYTKNKSPEVTQKATLEIIDSNDANAPKQLASFSNEGKSEDQITFANSNEILQNYLSQGYKVQKTAGNLSGDAQSGYTYPTYGDTAQDFKIYLIHDTEDKTETTKATAQVHYVVTDNGVQAPADSDLQTITYTRTNKVDKVNGTVVTEDEWKADKNAFTNVDSPDLSKDGYTPSLETVQFNAPERNVNQRVTVVYNRSAQAADLQIIDDSDPQNQRVLATYSAGGESGKQISFDGSNTQLQNYLKNGYTFEKSEGQGMSGDAANGFTYPSYDNDSKTNQSFKIYLKHATGDKKETVTTTAHVHYIMADGTKAPDDSPTQTINWTRTNTVDQVTGAIVKEGTWSSDKNAFTNVDSPAVTGYTPGTKTVKFATPERGVNQVVNVVYTKDAPTPDTQNALVVYQDVNDPAHPIDLGQSDQLSGQAGDTINYSTADKIAEYEKKGYVLVSNGFDANSTKPSFDNINGNTQTFYVTFKHGIQPVTPTTPGTPDQPINPDNPDGPKYPVGTDKTNLTKDVTRTVTYEGAGDKTPSPVTDTLYFEGTGYLDKVTGKWTDANGKELSDQTKGITWTIQDGTKDEGSFNLVPTKHIDGYTSKVVTDGADDGNGNVKSYTGLTHASDNINVVVKYNPIVVEQGNLIVKFHDDTEDKDLTDVGTDTGTQDVGTRVTYNPSTDLTNLENKGYVYVSTDGNIPLSIVKGTTTVTIHVKHGTVPVTPDNSGTPDQPINPNDPDGPKYPAGTDKTSIDRTITRTVHYEGADQYTPSDVQQPVHFTAKGVLDKVTGEWTTPLTWSEDQTFNGVTTPKIPGYHVVSVDKDTTDNQNVDSAKISHTGADYTVTVKYAKDDVPTPIMQGTIEVVYHDTTDNVDIPGYGRTQTKEDEGTSYSYNPNEKDLPALENKGYVLDGELPTIPTKYTDGDQRIVINVKHGTRPVTPENPAKPTDPVDPQHPGTPTPSNPNLSKTDLEKTITRTVKYQYADGTPAHDDSVQTVNFKGQGIIDLVTGNLVNVDKDGNIVDQRGKITWDHDSQDFGNVDAINHDGYYVSNISETGTTAQVTDTAVAKETVTPSSQNSTIVITLTKNPETPKSQQNAQLTIRDVTPGQEQDLGSYTQPGLEGDAISFGSAQEFVQNLLNKGYVWDDASYNGTNLSATDYAGINFGTYDNTADKNDISQKWVINLVHSATPVNPDHPDDKDGYTKEYLDRTITRDVTYVDEQNNPMPGLTPEHQEAKFQGSGYLDNVTGKWVTVENGKITGLSQGLTWTPDKDANFEAIAAKTADGYHVISVSGNGISGFTVGQDGSVTAQTVNKDTPSSTIKVVYAKTPVTPVPANGSIVYIDDTTGQTLENASFSGNVGDKINYTTADRIANYEKKGYDLVSNNFKDDEQVFTNGENKFEVHLVHATTPITPENPGKPSQEVPNPNDPNNPHTIPDNFVPQTLTKTITRDVTYVYEDGSQAESPVHQTFTFNGNGIVDLVTGQLVTVENGKIIGAGKITWNADSHDFEATKVIDTTQYNIVKVNENNTSANVDMSNGVVASETITPNSQDSAVVITLAKKTTPTPTDQTVVGKQVVHYVDEEGNKLRDDTTNDTVVFTKPGKTGQWNETSHKYADANVPVIDGYVADQKTYEGQIATPEDANKEIAIVYHKIGKIIPVDPSGNPIPDAPTTGYHNDSTDPTKVTPNEPTPNIPGWTTDIPNVTPEVPTKDTPVPYTKNPDTPVPANGSIVYIDDTTGNTLENATFSGNVGDKIDYTTAGRITNYINKGYKLVSNNFKDGNETFTKDGNKFEVHFVHDTVPVTPENPGKPGEPINPNDPNGPKYPDSSDQVTKTVTRTINYVGDGLNIPASHTEIEFTGRGVLDKVTGQWTTPLTWTVKGGNSDSGNFEQVDGPKADGYYITNISSSNEDLNYIDSTTGTVAGKRINHANGNIVITINYAKKTMPTPAGQTVVGKQVVHYVDEQGNKLRDDTTNDTVVFTKPGKTGQWNETSHKYADANAVVIDGYVSDQKTYEGQTATPEDANKEITIVYRKIGKIIPVDPSGNPIPDAPTPGYHNDSTDPTQVTPNEPTPNVPGWTTNVPNVTPEVPTQDTPVPYMKDKVPTPDQGSIEIVVHDNTTNTDLSTYGKKSGKQNVGTDFNFDKSTLIKDLENKGYTVVNPDVEIPSVVTKGDQKIVIYVKNKEERKDPITPEVPNLLAGDDNNNLPVPEKKETSIPTQPSENESTPNVEKALVTTQSQNSSDPVLPTKERKTGRNVTPHSATLPQTGNTDDSAAAIAGGALALIGLTGLTGATRKRRKN